MHITESDLRPFFPDDEEPCPEDIYEWQHSGDSPQEAATADAYLADLAHERLQEGYDEVRQIEILARFAKLRTGAGTSPKFGAADEAALARGWTVALARKLMARSVTIVDRLPQLLLLLETGRISPAQAYAIADAVARLNDLQVGELLNRVLPRVEQQTLRLLRQSLRRALIAIDPEAAEERHRKRVAKRGVRVIDTGEATAQIRIGGPADTVTRAMTAIDGQARQIKAMPDEGRTLPQIRSDIALDLLCGKGTGSTAPSSVSVTLPFTMLLGMPSTDAPELADYGPIPPSMALRISEDGIWRRMVTDPLTGLLLDVGREGHPSPRLTELVKLRDRICRVPGCNRSARRCQVEHVHDAPSASTAECSLCCLCDHHTKLCNTPGWNIRLNRSRDAVLTTPTGRSYVDTVEPITVPSQRSREES
ncbi:hypothetical protein D5S17_14000 [Pseudonocardiaceae bacterium YIM PH 21723]|nr:hypothetical protein D5S17_14000 [Pseudonocardiaceae bacterium YIM PH 21723]